MMKNLYLTLPSNTADFPENKTSDYRVKLPNPIELQGRWEMGLVEIQYPFSWNNIHAESERDRDNFLVFLVEPNYIPIVVDVSPGWYGTVDELFAAIQQGIEEAKKLNLKSLQTTDGTENETPENVDSIEAALKDGFHLTYDQIRKRVRLNLNTTLIKECFLGKHLQYLLGFPSDQSITFTAEKNLATYPPDLTGSFNTLYVYCNLVESQIVGGSLVPLLRTVPIEGKFGDSINKVFLSPHYLDLRTNSFDTIEISIRDDTDKPVKFNFGKSIVKLHLRKRQ